MVIGKYIAWPPTGSLRNSSHFSDFANKIRVRRFCHLSAGEVQSTSLRLEHLPPRLELVQLRLNRSPLGSELFLRRLELTSLRLEPSKPRLEPAPPRAKPLQVQAEQVQLKLEPTSLRASKVPLRVKPAPLGGKLIKPKAHPAQQNLDPAPPARETPAVKAPSTP